MQDLQLSLWYILKSLWVVEEGVPHSYVHCWPCRYVRGLYERRLTRFEVLCNDLRGGSLLHHSPTHRCRRSSDWTCRNQTQDPTLMKSCSRAVPSLSSLIECTIWDNSSVARPAHRSLTIQCMLFVNAMRGPYRGLYARVQVRNRESRRCWWWC